MTDDRPAITAANLNDPAVNPPQTYTPDLLHELPADHRAGVAAFLSRLEELLGHGVLWDLEESDHGEPGGKLIAEVHSAVVPEDGQTRTWVFTLFVQFPGEEHPGVDWHWWWDIDNDPVECDRALNADGWPRAEHADAVADLLRRELADFDQIDGDAFLEITHPAGDGDAR